MKDVRWNSIKRACLLALPVLVVTVLSANLFGSADPTKFEIGGSRARIVQAPAVTRKYDKKQYINVEFYLDVDGPRPRWWGDERLNVKVSGLKIMSRSDPSEAYHPFECAAKILKFDAQRQQYLVWLEYNVPPLYAPAHTVMLKAALVRPNETAALAVIDRKVTVKTDGKFIEMTFRFMGVKFGRQENWLHRILGIKF
jgi:hypothetical protein